MRITSNFKDPFLSTLSLRRATQAQGLKIPAHRISIHALLAESDRDSGLSCHSGHQISIHALLAESDQPKREWVEAITISIHALLAESDLEAWYITPGEVQFLSTLSLRRATAQDPTSGQELHAISIHALLAESDIISPLYSIV